MVARRCAEAPGRLRITLIGAAFTLGLAAASVAFAATPVAAEFPEIWAALQNDAALQASGHPKPDPEVEIEARKSYAIPALEIVGFDVLVNLANRSSNGDFRSNLSTIRHNLHGSWVVDSDPFKTNQLGHPYQGSMYHGFARSAGLDYWQAAAYTFAGSAFWEIAGERTPPSRSDQIASGIGGSFLGEVLFRLSNLVLEHENVPLLWREIGAALVSPATGFNRLAFGVASRRFFRATTRFTTAAYRPVSAAAHKTNRARRRPNSSAARRSSTTRSTTGCQESPGTRTSVPSMTSASRRPPRAPTGSRT